MKFTPILAVLPFVAVGQVAAICGGFNYAIGNVIPLGNGINRWNVYNDNCEVVDGLTTNLNPCTEGIFGCTSAPITFNEYTNSFSGLRYACRGAPDSGTCGTQYGGTDVISVCCRNDGN